VLLYLFTVWRHWCDSSVNDGLRSVHKSTVKHVSLLVLVADEKRRDVAANMIDNQINLSKNTAQPVRQFRCNTRRDHSGSTVSFKCLDMTCVFLVALHLTGLRKVCRVNEPSPRRGDNYGEIPLGTSCTRGRWHSRYKPVKTLLSRPCSSNAGGVVSHLRSVGHKRLYCRRG